MKLKLKYKILLLFATVSLGILFITGALLTAKLKREKFSSIQDSLQSQLDCMNFALTTFISEIGQDLRFIAENPYVKSRDDANFTNFMWADESSFQYKIGELEQKIIDVFRRYRETHEYVSSVYMGRENGSFVRSHKRNRPTRYDPRERPWYQLGKKNPGKIVHTLPYSSVTSTDINIGVVKALVDEAGNVYGVVGIDVTLANLTKYVEKITVGRNGYVMVLDREGTILASQDRSLLNQSILAMSRDDLDSLFTQERGVTTFTRDKEKHYLFFNYYPALNWKIVFAIPTRQIEQEIRSFIIPALVVLSVSLFFLSFLTVVGLEYLVVRPLNRLNEGTKIIASTGDLDYKIQLPSGDEIGSLAASFNLMTRDLKAHIKRLTETKAAQERIESELRIAHDIQMDLLPKRFPPFPDRTEFDIHAFIKPAKQVGGDFYDFFLIDSDHLFFVIGDVSDKGVPAALFMAKAKSLIKFSAKGTYDPAEILDTANKELSSDNDSSMFVTAFCGILTISAGDMCYGNAGHNPPLIIRQENEVEPLKRTGNTALGIDADSTFSTARLVLEPDDILFLYTDGVTEACNNKQELFSEERLMRKVSYHRDDSMKELVLSILQEVTSFSQDMPQADDITILGLRYLGKRKG